MLELPDYRPGAIARRNKHVVRFAKQLGLVSGQGIKSGAEKLPANLCQAAVARERELAQKAVVRYFANPRDKGRRVYYVTICRPAWTCPAGDLSASLIREVSAWTSRRARNLAAIGQQRMIGFVDLAWNDLSAVRGVSHWNVHAHVLIAIEPNAPQDLEAIRRAFSCDGDGERIEKPIVIKTPKDSLDVFRVGEYNSRALLFEHHQRRRTYITRAGQRDSRDLVLARAQALELAEVVHEVGPRGFWILSGLRRKYGEIALHSAKAGQE